MPKPKPALLDLDGRVVAISNPDKVYFPDAGITKLEVAQYYVAVAEGALRGVRRRPMQLERYVNGITEPPFYQKRAPPKLPDFLHTATLRFPSMRTADELVVENAAGLLWVVNLGCLALHPHPVREDDLDHPDELRIDLDPMPGVEWPQVRDVAQVAREVLAEHGLPTWPKTSGSRGMHLLVRLEPRWTFPEVRQAALAVAREVEKRMPGRATSRWWKEERVGVFLDYNQNAKDRTVASAYSVRAKPDGRVSMPLAWDEVATCDPADHTLRTAPRRFAERGLAARARAGLGGRARRRPVAAALPEGRGGAAAGPAVPQEGHREEDSEQTDGDRRGVRGRKRRARRPGSLAYRSPCRCGKASSSPRLGR
jgi:bifunctional non-homologous end joining protein LigD